MALYTASGLAAAQLRDGSVGYVAGGDLLVAESECDVGVHPPLRSSDSAVA